MKMRKLGDKISQKDTRDMVRYARKTMEDFRGAKHEKNILFLTFLLILC